MSYLDSIIDEHMESLPRMGEHLTARVREAMVQAVSDASTRMLRSDPESRAITVEFIHEHLPLTTDES